MKAKDRFMIYYESSKNVRYYLNYISGFGNAITFVSEIDSCMKFEVFEAAESIKKLLEKKITDRIFHIQKITL